jgi:hypothetical protein
MKAKKKRDEPDASEILNQPVCLLLSVCLSTFFVFSQIRLVYRRVATHPFNPVQFNVLGIRIPILFFSLDKSCLLFGWPNLFTFNFYRDDNQLAILAAIVIGSHWWDPSIVDSRLVTKQNNLGCCFPSSFLSRHA